MTAFNKTVSTALSPESTEQAFALYDSLGLPVAVAVLLPLFTILVYGFALGEHRRQNFWLLLISGFVIGIGVVAGFPLALMHL